MSAYEVRLEVFEGPLDLLLHLIKKNEINIYDIPIALISRQYLEYVDLMKHLNLELAGEFLVMAATLTQIKSRMLLPKEESPEEAEAEDPRAELVRRLLEYQRYKEVAESLEEREVVWREVFQRAPAPEPAGDPEEVRLSPALEVGLFDLVGALQKVLERLPSRKALEFQAEEFSVKDKISLILDRLDKEERVSFSALFEGMVSRRAVVVTFLALLELAKMGLIRVFQLEDTGDIELCRRISEEPVDGG
jgi:segregation and condensation protein A